MIIANAKNLKNKHMLNFILGLIVGGVGVWFVIRKRMDSRLRGNDRGVVTNPEQVEKRRKNLERVLELARQKGEIANDDVERILDVSNATAERYLQELEEQSKLVQVGTTGRNVLYRLKK